MDRVAATACRMARPSGRNKGRAEPESYERAYILARAKDESDRKPKLICNSSAGVARTGYNL